jgi:hypothetical protein
MSHELEHPYDDLNHTDEHRFSATLGAARFFYFSLYSLVATFSSAHL